MNVAPNLVCDLVERSVEQTTKGRWRAKRSALRQTCPASAFYPSPRRNAAVWLAAVDATAADLCPWFV